MGDLHEDRPPPAWAGDVSLGVDAWTQREEPRRAQRRQPAPPPDPVADGPEADPESVARTILLDQLTGRARSRKELGRQAGRQARPRRRSPPGCSTGSRRSASSTTRPSPGPGSRLAGRGSTPPGAGWRPRALAQELRRKGVDDTLVKEVLDDVDPDDEEQSARVLVRKKLRSVARVDDTTATRRLVGMLARKGYGSSLAFSVVREELAAADGATTPEV